MTPQEGNRLIIDPNYIMIVDLDQLKLAGLTLNDVYSAFDRGMILTADIYRIVDKDNFIEDLKKKNDNAD